MELQEQKQEEAKKDAPPGANPFGASARDKNSPPVDVSKLPETTGEKWFRRVRFVGAEVVILAVGAVLAYRATYNKGGWLNRAQGWLDEKFKQLPILKDYDRQRQMLSSTFVLGNGGNLFAPLMYAIDYHKKKIVGWINEHYGSPEEVKIAEERLKDEAKPTLMGVVMGRVISYTVVFLSFVGLDLLAGKSKTTGAYRLDQAADWFGRKTSAVWGYISGGSTEIGKLDTEKHPLGKSGSIPERLHNMAHKLGEILLWDFIATGVGLFFWTKYDDAKVAKETKKQKAAAQRREREEYPSAPAPAAATQSKDEALGALGQAQGELEKARQYAGAVSSRKGPDARTQEGYGAFVKTAEAAPALAQGI